MIETFLDPTFAGSVTAWATNLTAEINSGKFKSDAAGWISCSSITETQPGSKRAVLRGRSVTVESAFPEFTPSDTVSALAQEIRPKVAAFDSAPKDTGSELANQIRAVIEARSVEAALPHLECPLIWAQEANAFDCVSIRFNHFGDGLITLYAMN